MSDFAICDCVDLKAGKIMNWQLWQGGILLQSDLGVCFVLCVSGQMSGLVYICLSNISLPSVCHNTK